MTEMVLDIDPRIADRLRRTFETRISEFDAEATALLKNLIIGCRGMGQGGNIRFDELADRLEQYCVLLEKHPPHTADGMLIRENLIAVSNDLGRMFAKLAAISEKIKKAV